MGLQLHRPQRTRKSKRRTQFNLLSLQHQAQHQHTRHDRTAPKTPKLETQLQGNPFARAKTASIRSDLRLSNF